MTGPNYHDWFRNLMIVLNSERIAYVLDKKPPKEAAPDISRTELAKLEKHWDRDLQAKSYMLASMSNELQRRFEEAVNAADIHLHLKECYAVQTRSERHATVKELMTTRLRDGTSIHEHGVRMIGLIEKLVGLDVVISSEISTDILLLSLSVSFDGFVGAQNKGKKRSAPPKKNKHNKKPYKKPNPGPTMPDKSEQVFFHFNKPGHWRRNCEEYLAQKRSGHGDGKKQEA
ncbi:uncharacterized protein LOC142521882 [Primulina tabacum]|uniref:uncharacterized protein LOC142521882 n=1 Tax=Primulina tabacum TaxID=48773 RepID=UPI003F59614F